jgi:potassium efflux system protein
MAAKMTKRLHYRVLLYHIRGQGLAVLAFALFMLTPVLVMAADQKSQKFGTATPPAPAPAPAVVAVSTPGGPQAVPVADVAARAAAVSNLLRTLMNKLTISAEIDTISKSLPEFTVQVDQAQAETMRVLQGHPALPTIQTQQEQWQQLQLTYTRWLKTLTKGSNELHDEMVRLGDLQKIWAMTLDAARAAKAPAASLQQINDTIAKISAAQGPLKERLNLALDLQGQIGNGVSKCGTVLAAIAQVQKASVSNVLVQDSLPVWSAKLFPDARNELPGYVHSAAAAYWQQAKDFFGSPSGRVPLYAEIAVLMLIFVSARHQVRRWTAAGEVVSPDIRVLNHPFAATLTMSLLIATSPYWLVLPANIRNTFQVISLAPIIILIRPVVSVRLVPGLYALGVLFAVDAVRRILSVEQLTGQVFLILESFSGMVLVIWLLRNLQPSPEEPAVTSRLRVIQTGAVLAFLILVSGFAAAVMGYVRLARLMIPVIIAGGVLVLLLYASVRVLIGIVALALRVWPLRTFGMIRHHRNLLERRIYRFLVWIGIAGWIIRYLSYIGLLTPTMAFGETLLNTKLERGAFSISAGDVLEFILTVWAAYLLSAFIRFALQEDVYPRIRISSGKSYAVSSLLHYFIIALGFTAAIAGLGVNLTKLTVLTGAFGVGIGFGLQSVVNNFVSGLILLFERPILVGDTVEVGELLGKVRRIGIRASTVHTRQGADIIVPNSQLVAEKVTNWTLSDLLRRIELPVGVSYSSPPNKVIKVLEGVAIAHPQILSEPAPQALFVSYGDSSLNFELRAWTAEFDDWPKVRSALAAGVYDAVRAAGMSFPFPQREVRLLGDPVRGNAAAAGQ